MLTNCPHCQAMVDRLELYICDRCAHVMCKWCRGGCPTPGCTGRVEAR